MPRGSPSATRPRGGRLEVVAGREPPRLGEVAPHGRGIGVDERLVEQRGQVVLIVKSGFSPSIHWSASASIMATR